MASIMDSIKDEQITEKIEISGATGTEKPIENTNQGLDFGGFFNIFKLKSSTTPIEEYQEHPLNYDKKKSTGRIIRGLEGLLGALNYAIVDLVMGLIEKWKEGKIGS